MPDSLRIVFFVEHFAVTGQGAENDAVQLCRALAERGHEVHVIADDFSDFSDIQCHRGLDSIDRHLAAIQPDLTVDWGLFHRADVHRIGGGIHERFIPYNLEAYRPLARWWKRLGYLKGKHRRIVARERDLLTNPNARFLAISRFVADHAIASGADPERVTVLHNAVDTERFSPDGANDWRQTTRAEWGVPDEAVVFLFVAQNLRLKNLELVRRTFRWLRGRIDRPFRVVVIGNRQPSFGDPFIIAPGPYSRIEHAYAGADALIHPTWFDSFGNVVLEAMSCGLPVMVSDRAGVAELIEHGTDGMVLPVNGGDAVASHWGPATHDLVNSDEYRSEMGRAARQKALRHGYGDYLDRIEGYLVEAAAARRH